MTLEGLLRLFGSSPILRLFLAYFTIDMVKGSALLILAASADRGPLRRDPARSRSLWLALLLTLTVLPLAWLWLPPLRVFPVPPGAPGRGLSTAALRRIVTGDFPGLPNTVGADAALATLAVQGVGSAARALGRFVEWAWLAGAFLGLARIVEGSRRARSVSVFLRDPAWPPWRRNSGPALA